MDSDQSANPPPDDGKKPAPGGPLATPNTQEGKDSADAEGEEA
jgi:hypothetical protein